MDAAASAATDVKVLRVVSSQVGGRMLTAAEAPDREKLAKFFEACCANCEWIMRIGLDAQPEETTGY